jgi:hypothetical protein
MNESFEQRFAAMQDLIVQNNRQQVAASASPVAEPIDPYAPDYADKLASSLEQKLDAKLVARERATMERQSAISELASDYPELANPESALAKESIKVLAQLDPSIKNSAIGYKLAVREAAAKSGILPKAKRTSASDDFSLSNSNSASKPTSKKVEVDNKTLEFAQLMGLNTSDEKLLKRLSTISKGR